MLFWKGFSGLSLAVFTQMTPPPGSAGGLLNAIVGSLIMTVIGVAVGTPFGMLAGTYLAEYGRYSKLALVVRFINDILLSAPSIVIGLFVYEIVVAPLGPFSGHCRHGRARRSRRAGRRAHDGRHAEPGAQPVARGGFGARHAALAGDPAHRLPRGARRSPHRRSAGRRAGQRRNRAAAVHGAQQPVLEHES